MDKKSIELSDKSSSKNTKVVLLGTGTPVPDPMRFGPSVAIIVGGKSYLIDFGPGIVRRASAAYYQLGIKALQVRQLNKAFLTHLHSDHTVGYPDLIFTPWVMGRNKPLEVYGPKGTKEMTDHILSAYNQDINERIKGLEPANDIGYKVNVHEIVPGIIYEDSKVVVEAFSVKHGSWPAFGFKFTTKDRTIVISGDTAPFDGLLKYYKNCDVLIHEVYLKKGFNKRPANWEKYHSSVHTSTYELAEIAAKAKPGLLILYHQLFWIGNDEELLLEIQEKYDGKVVSGKDLEVY
jgi:ribonuclease BN (tRNA processing enzyme)